MDAGRACHLARWQVPLDPGPGCLGARGSPAM